jgi:protocatechuate 3,4-dioxygenase beta subunit
MRNFDEVTITDAVLERVQNAPDPRVRQISEALVRHLHGFVREIEPTFEEWQAGIDFLTRVGKLCDANRQEFILLSDTLGLSRLVNLMHDAEGREAAGTETSLLGPFFRERAPEFALGDSIAVHDTAGTEVVLFGEVLDAAGRPVPGAEIDVWQTNAAGLYDLQARDATVMDMRGRFRADGQGRFHLRTVKPIGYSIPMDGPVGRLVHRQGRHGMRPAHIHILVAAEGYRDLVTALYLADDPNIGSDTVFGVSASLVVQAEMGVPGNPRPDLPGIRYDFRLSRKAAGETGGRVGADPSSITPVAAAQ